MTFDTKSAHVVAVQFVREEGQRARAWSDFRELLEGFLDPMDVREVIDLVEEAWLETPAEPGVYVTVRLDDDAARVTLGAVSVEFPVRADA